MSKDKVNFLINTPEKTNFPKIYKIHVNSDVQGKIGFFYYKFRFYTSSMYEICIHCHLLGFSWFRMNYGQWTMWSDNIIHLLDKAILSHFFSFQIHTTPSRGILRILKPEENQNSRKFSRARCPFQFTQLKSVHN